MFDRTKAAGGMILGFGLCCLHGQTQALAQYPVGVPTTTTTYETVQPGYKSVTYGEKIKVRRFLGRTVTVEKPRRFVTVTPPVVQETRVVRPAPIAQQVIVQPAPVVTETWVQPPPVLERSVVQPAPVVQTRLIPQEPVTQTRYVGGAPF